MPPTPARSRTRRRLPAFARGRGGGQPGRDPGSALACAAILAGEAVRAVRRSSPATGTASPWRAVPSAHATLGIDAILCLSGDHQSMGACAQAAGEHDIDSIQLTQALKTMGASGSTAWTRKLDAGPELPGRGCRPPVPAADGTEPPPPAQEDRGGCGVPADAGGLRPRRASPNGWTPSGQAGLDKKSGDPHERPARWRASRRPRSSPKGRPTDRSERNVIARLTKAPDAWPGEGVMPIAAEVAPQAQTGPRCPRHPTSFPAAANRRRPGHRAGGIGLRPALVGQILHIHTVSMPGRFRRVGKFGSVDWREDCSRCTNCVKPAALYDVYKNEGRTTAIRRPTTSTRSTSARHASPACRAAPRACSASINPEFLAMGDEYWKPDSCHHLEPVRHGRSPSPAPAIAGGSTAPASIRSGPTCRRSSAPRATASTAASTSARRSRSARSRCACAFRRRLPGHPPSSPDRAPASGDPRHAPGRWRAASCPRPGPRRR